MAKTKGAKKLRLIQSDEKSPLVKLRAGEKLEVVSTTSTRCPSNRCTGGITFRA